MRYLGPTVLLVLSALTVSSSALGQAGPYPIDLASLFGTSNCQVTNINGPRPKVVGGGNEQEGCAEANLTGRSYTSVAPVSGSPTLYTPTPAAAKNILIHPPTPAYQYTRVKFAALDAIPDGVWQAEDWVLTFTCGIAYSPASTSDGVDLYISAGGLSQGCAAPEVALHQQSVFYNQEPTYHAIVIPAQILQRAASFIAIEVRPRGNNFSDHFILSNPVIRPAIAGLSLVDQFASASVITNNYVPLTSSWATLSQSLGAGGAAHVPSSVMNACSGWLMNQGNNDAARTILAVPPPNQFCRIDYSIAQAMPAARLHDHEWFFSARVSLNSSVSGSGAGITVVVEGKNPAGQGEWGNLANTVTVSDGESRYLCQPVGMWSARNDFKLNIQVESNGSNVGDLILIENPRLVALPMSHGLESVSSFGYWFGYPSGAYPSHGTGTYNPAAPQFDDMEPFTNAVIIHGWTPNSEFDQRIAEARRLGQDVIWMGHSVFFDYFAGSIGLFPDYAQRWNNVKNTMVAPNLDVIKYLYIEEVYTHTGNYAATNSALATVGALVKADFPQLKIIYADVGTTITAWADVIDIPSTIDVIGFEAMYSTSWNGHEVQHHHAHLNRIAKANHKFLLVPPCIDRVGASEHDKHRILRYYLDLARVDERYIGIAPFMWWWHPMPAWGDQLGLYDTPSISAYKRRYLALGKSIRQRYAHKEQFLGGGATMACPGAGDLAVFSAQRLGAGVPFVVSLRGAPVTPVAVLMASPYWGYTQFSCGYVLGPDPALTSIVVQTDHMGRYFLKAPAVAGPLDLFFQAGYFIGDVAVLTKVVRMQY